jgi:drug/metabolite transporter (DMT)-like permease
LNDSVRHKNKQALVALHSAVLLFALSGLFAKWLNLPAIFIVFGRAFFAAITIAIFVFIFKRQSLKCESKTLVAFAITGAILAFHWGSFFQSIKVSSVAIGLITFATFPVFVSFLEPIFLKEQFCFRALIQAILTVIGISLILPENTIDSHVIIGAFWGTISALSFALLTVLNRKFVAKISAKKVAFYQNAFAALFLLPLIVIEPMVISIEQLAVLALLGIVFTAFAHSIFNHSLKTISAQTASIAVSLEPIYGIIAAYFLLNESVSLMMILGGGIVLATNVWALNNK